MRFLSGRASCGARATLRALIGSAFAILGLIAGGCGSTTYTYGTPVITFTSTPGPFSAYIVQVDQIYLTRSDNTTVYPLLTAESVDFTQFTDITELFGTPALIEGNYVSATVTVDYSAPQIYANINGKPTLVSNILDGNGTPDATTGVLPAAGIITYTVKFDPAHPLVIKNGVSTPINFNFDMSASSVLDTSTGTPTLTVHPVLTVSTQPNPATQMHARGLYVVTDTANSNFTLNSREFFDLLNSPVGAVTIQTDANTVFNINGLLYTGAAGLAQINTLQISSIVEAYWTLGSLDGVKPTFVATQVYAGLAAQNYATTQVTGTVQQRSGNTLTIAGAEFVEYVGSASTTGVELEYFPTLSIAISDSTLVSIDGAPASTATSTQLISVGQKVNIQGLTVLDSAGIITSVDATNGLVRLQSTPAWGNVNAGAQATTASVDLLTLGNFEPGEFVFTGTGTAGGTGSNPTAYVVNNTSGVDLSALSGTLVRFDGLVAPFGATPPDFNAAAVTPASATPQMLVINWVNGGSVAPFTSVTSAGLTLNLSDANLGSSHFVQSGPLNMPTTDNTVDLTNPLVNAQIVPNTDPTKILQLAVGNSSATQYAVFNSYASFLTQLNTVLNGTNKIEKLVAVGQWNGTTFTADQIDIVQMP